jgi:hypothetical protein
MRTTATTLPKKITMMSIERLWQQLADAAPGGAQTRVEATHPLDIYADLQPPDRIGLVAVCGVRPPDVRPMRALSVEVAKRSDGRWTLRLSLVDSQLAPVFAALCRDVIACTRCGVDEARLGQVVVQRIVHWRTLLESSSVGLGDATLRGLIGELLVLRNRLVPVMTLTDAVGAWRGPFGAPQDFVLPSGERIEVKTVGPLADQATIHGLAQLDGAGDPLSLMVVRAEDVPPTAPGAVSAPALIKEMRELLAAEPEAQAEFDSAFVCIGWHDHPAHGNLALRVSGMEMHGVGPDFPHLTRANVPGGVLEADYLIALPPRIVPERGDLR